MAEKTLQVDIEIAFIFRKSRLHESRRNTNAEQKNSKHRCMSLTFFFSSFRIFRFELVIFILVSHHCLLFGTFLALGLSQFLGTLQPLSPLAFWTFLSLNVFFVSSLFVWLRTMSLRWFFWLISEFYVTASKNQLPDMIEKGNVQGAFALKNQAFS